MRSVPDRRPEAAFDTYAEIFRERAGEYHAAMKHFPRARDAEFLAVVEPLGEIGEGLACDMPSGGAYLAAYLPPGLRYVGVEPASGFFLEWPRGLDRLNADITEVPLADGSIDCIVSLAGLHHELSLVPVFREMRRLLRRGGRLVIADVAVDTPPAFFLNGFVAANNPLGHDGRFLDGSTAGLLEGAGFAVRDDALLEVPWTFGSRQQAGEFCRLLFGMTGLDAARVAEAMQAEIGFEDGSDGPRLKWVLRRIVADAI